MGLSLQRQDLCLSGRLDPAAVTASEDRCHTWGQGETSESGQRARGLVENGGPSPSSSHAYGGLEGSGALTACLS